MVEAAVSWTTIRKGSESVDGESDGGDLGLPFDFEDSDKREEMNAYTDEQKQSYDELGYFIVKDAVEPGMTARMLDAARRVKAKIRAGQLDIYTDFRGELEPYHFGGLLSPRSEEPVFAEYMGCKPLLDYVFAQVGTDLTLGNLTIFTNPQDKPFICQWHRDDGGGKAGQAEEPEIAYLRQPRRWCRWELALVDDCALGLVPGSHRRYRTPEEIEATKEGLDKRLPGDLVVDLKAGETIFWNGDALHRALHQPDRERLTISASFRLFYFRLVRGICG